ncbi:hypothetical protein DID88_006888 [Monilinia fructigena]|uniref:Uncharacterized protein n=1 Tax=Monilinia fructigena TaxID=38457 RepID=A0A395ILY6_9HELO|nr:hypothetical protein DID88_006888 [Monilinia fructigena]
MSPPSRQLLDVPGFGGYYMESRIFTRFRGKKTTVRISRQFEDLYDWLLNPSYQSSETETTPINASTLTA